MKEGDVIDAALPEHRHADDPTRTPPPEVVDYHPGRPPWSAPRGRDLLAGIAVLSVLVAILVVFSRNDPPTRYGAALAFARGGVAVAAPSAPPEWTEVPVATSVLELGPALSRPVEDGLAVARARIARCVGIERRRHALAAHSDGAPPAPTGAGPAELVLRLAARSGAVHVVGVEVKAVGATPEVTECARRHLDDDIFPAEGTVPGRRHRLLVTVE